jgi:hypothetical protein
MQPRYLHIVPIGIAGAIIFILNDLFYIQNAGKLPGLEKIWVLALIIPMLSGALVTLAAGGAKMWKRIIGAALCGVSVGVFSSLSSAAFGALETFGAADIAVNCLWRAFVFTIFSVIGVLITEIKLPEPQKTTVED